MTADDARTFPQVAARHADVETLRDVLRVHHPTMRSETGPFSGCRCGQVKLGQDVIAHVTAQLAAALDAAEARGRAEGLRRYADGLRGVLREMEDFDTRRPTLTTVIEDVTEFADRYALAAEVQRTGPEAGR